MRSGDTFLLCPPRFYGVEYVINPWMEGNVGRVDPAVATEQWDGLCRLLASRARLEMLDPGRGLPDMVFTANAGLVLEDVFVPARLHFPERRPETPRVTAWFRQRGYRVLELAGQGTFEGEGDALFQPGEGFLWAGYGVRSSLQAHRELAELLGIEIVPLRLVDERFYHLDTCFCPLPDGRLVYYPDAFDRESLATIAARVPADRCFAVDASDAFAFACNAIVTAGAFITNAAGTALQSQLAAWGLEAIVCPLDQFLRAGGAAKCLALAFEHPGADHHRTRGRVVSAVAERVVEVQGHLLDTDLMDTLLDTITDGGGSFEIESFQAGLRHDQASLARVRIAAPSAARLETILTNLIALGARGIEQEADAHLEPVEQAGVAPPDFYSTTIFPTDVRIGGTWTRAAGQRMDAVLVVDDDALGTPRVTCRLLRDLLPAERVVCGIDGVRTHPTHVARARESFGFMTATASSERRVEIAVERIAWEMRRLREREGRVVAVAGPVVIHTGGGPYLARLIRAGHVQALLGGNGLAAHDLEQALFGTSLGIDLQRGVSVRGGHQNHLRAINLVRAAGSIAAAVRRGQVSSGIMYECVTHDVPFVLAGSIRDDGPLPDTRTDLIAAQEEYARLIDGADMILLLSSMLHAIGVGNMTPAGVRLVCVDISPAVVTKLADRGSIESTGIVTDVALFLDLLGRNLGIE